MELNNEAFHDSSSSAFRLSGPRFERPISKSAQLAAFYALYRRDASTFLDAVGAENRRVVDVHVTRSGAPFDWDIEAMGQFGTVGSKEVSAWALGAHAGFTANNTRWRPRVGVQFDMASGDRRSGDDALETFNPLFPNGVYFALGGHTGYTNVVHLKPSLTLRPTNAATITLGMGALWRMTTQDAVYTFPSVPVPGTAGEGARWTGAYAQLRADYQFSQSLGGGIEVVRYNVGSTLRSADADDSTYIRLETRFAW